MAAKSVQMSDDNGVTWYTLPGSQGSFSVDGDSLDDTVFGQTYKSNFPGILSWKVEANAIYKGIAGYSATIKQTGTTTAMTTEACTLVSGKTYRITNTAKRVIDPAVTPTVFDNAVNRTTEVLEIDYLMGTVTFKNTYTVTGAVTITGSYFPMVTLGKAKTWDLKQTAELIDNSDLATAQANGGYNVYTPGLRTVTLDLKSFYAVTSGLRAAITGRTTVLIEINPDGAGKSIARGFFKATSESQSGDVGALEEESTTFVLNVPSSSYVPFNWYQDATSTLHTSLQRSLTSWLNQTVIDVQYLYDGTNGVKGDAVVTDISLSGGLNAMNTFSVGFQGSGVITAVGTG